MDEFGQTVVMVTHDAHAASTADRVVVLVDGRVVADRGALGADEVLDLMKKVAGQRVKSLVSDKRSHAERLKELYTITFSRQPTAEELTRMTAYIEARPNATAAAYEDVVWALLNTKEFLFNH